MRRLWIVLGLVVALPVLAGEGPVFMWHAEKDGATIDLLGSVHAGKEGWYPLDDRIEAALADADTVACELDVTDPATLMQVMTLMQKEGMYPEGESLKDHVSEETWTELVRRLGSMVPPAALERMRPGLAATTLAQITLTEAGLDASAGVDMHVLKVAEEAEKPIVALETVEEQVGLLFGPDAAIDALMLEEALQDDAEDMVAMLESILEAWQAGDPKAMDDAYREDWLDVEKMQKFHEELLVKRNERMAANLAGRTGNWFAVVGALHLCGTDGVPALLAEAGWTVEQVGVGVMAR
jgi:uncharacterized protein YbaP (TraB family)